MAAGSTYPADLQTLDGIVRESGNIQFTDSTNQPAPGGSSNEATAKDFAATGLTGAVQVTRYVGGVATVAPTTGTFAIGDFVIARNGDLFVCTVAGTPGTWVVGGSVSLAAKASPTFTGVPAAPTAAVDTATTQLATTAFVVNQAYAKLAGPTLTGTVTVPAAAAPTSAARLSDLSSYLTITSGALPAFGAWASGTAQQNPVARAISVIVEFVTDASNNLATCAIAISPDNVTYTTVGTLSLAQALNNVGAVKFVSAIPLPNAWYIKLTFAQGTVAASKYY